ncbi:MAG: ribosome-associated translation inhibitor RaiA [Clostridia bacterium]|nr:ribosome-associated translation inhibitor RaiA [Clostridia bacterium]
MLVQVNGRQMNVRESLREVIEKKLHKFDRFFDDSTVAYVTCKARKGVKIIEITVSYGGTLFRAEEESDTFVTALDRAMESFERQIRKNKTRLEKRVRAGAFAPAPDDVEEDEFAEEGEFVIRTKTYAFKPMTPEEAILQMNLLEHSFFVFNDGDTGQTCVVYRRKDGGYGLIVPE